MPLASALANLSPKSRALIAPPASLISRSSVLIAPDHFHEGQLEAWESHKVDVVVAAGTQGGKTEEERFWLAREIRRSAPFIKKLGFGRAIYAGPTMTLMEQQVIPQFRAYFEDELQLGKYIGGTKPVFRFSPEGSKWLVGFECSLTVHFAYMTSANNIESMTGCCGVWDEAGQSDNKQDAYEAFNRRLKAARSWTFGEAYDWLESENRLEEFSWWIKDFYLKEGRSARFGRRFWGTTPYEWNWFKEKIYDRAEQKHDDFSLHNFDSWMNPLVSKEACEEELALGMEPWKWDMMYRGRFTRPAGVIYENFGDHNICAPFLIPHDWDHVMGIDFGPVHTSACIGVLNPERTKLYIYATYLNTDGQKDAETHVYNILSKARDYHERENGEVRLYAGGFNSWGGSPSEDEWRSQFNLCGLPVARPGLRELEPGITSVRAALSPLNGGPKLVVFKHLTPLIKELREYSRVLGQDALPTDKIKDKEKYHRADSVRYLVSSIWPFVAESKINEARWMRRTSDD